MSTYVSSPLGQGYKHMKYGYTWHKNMNTTLHKKQTQYFLQLNNKPYDKNTCIINNYNKKNGNIIYNSTTRAIGNSYELYMYVLNVHAHLCA